jgi:hypothetical protein
LRGKNVVEEITSSKYEPLTELTATQMAAVTPFSDKTFRDPKLDAFFESDDLDGAREYLDRIYRIADEMCDVDTVVKYKIYEDRFIKEEEPPTDWLINN